MVEVVAGPDAAAQGRRALHRALPVPRRADAELLRQPGRQALLLLRLRRGRRRDQRSSARPSSSTSRRRSSGWPSASASTLEYEESSPERDAERSRRERLLALLEQAASFYERYLWESDARRAGARVPRGARPRRGGLPRVPARAARPAARRSARKAREKGFTGARARRGRPRQPARQRLLRRPAALPARRRARARARVPGTEAPRGRPAAGEVRQLARGRALPQGRPALRARPGAGGDRQAGARDRRRGQHRRARAPAGGPRAGRRLDGHRAHRAAAEGALAADAQASGSASTATRPGEAATLRGMELAAAQGFDVRVVALPPGSDPADAPEGFEERLAARRELPRSTACGSRSSARPTGRQALRPRARGARRASRGLARAAGRGAARRRPARPAEGDAGRLRAGHGPDARRVRSRRGCWRRAPGSSATRSPGVAAHPELRELLAELTPEHFDAELHRRAREHLLEPGEPDAELVPLLAELDARAATEGIDEETAKELLLRLRERQLRRELASRRAASATQRAAGAARARSAARPRPDLA